MKWTALVGNFISITRRCLWLACWLTIIANNSGLLAKPRGTAANSRGLLKRSAGLVSSSDPEARSWRVTTLATKVSPSSSVLEPGSIAGSMKLTKAERLRRRKLERKQKRLSKQQTMKKSKSRSHPARHGTKDIKTKLKDSLDTDPDWSAPAAIAVNAAKDNMQQYAAKSITAAENDVLAHGKANRYAMTPRDLYSMMLEIESKLLGEMVRSRDTNDLLAKHSTWIDVLNRTVSENDENFTKLQSEVEHIRNVLKSEDEYHRSIEVKLSGLMLDIAEVNNLLSTSEKRASTRLEDKTIPVESSPMTHCQHTANVTRYRDCEELYHHGHTTSGVYYISPLYSSCPLPVYCDMDTPPGGWMVFQRRQDGSTNFTKDWVAYRQGFGDVTKEFWLGNDNLFLLTNQLHYQLRVDLWDFYGSRVFAEYLHFKVDGERDRYRLHVSNHTGTAPDSLHNHNEVYFSTPDRDNDLYPSYHCAKEWEAGWWFSNCWFAILNGRYHDTTKVEYRGISWNDWKAEQLQKVEMKMRPSGY